MGFMAYAVFVLCVFLFEAELLKGDKGDTFYTIFNVTFLYCATT